MKITEMYMAKQTEKDTVNYIGMKSCTTKKGININQIKYIEDKMSGYPRAMVTLDSY